jgi:hypothetical protein
MLHLLAKISVARSRVLMNNATVKIGVAAEGFLLSSIQNFSLYEEHSRVLRSRACYVLKGVNRRRVSRGGHSRARGNPGGPPDLDPGVRRDDMFSEYPYPWPSIQHA